MFKKQTNMDSSVSLSPTLKASAPYLMLIWLLHHSKRLLLVTLTIPIFSVWWL